MTTSGTTYAESPSRAANPAAQEPQEALDEAPASGQQLSLIDEPTEEELMNELSFAENPVAVVEGDGLTAMGEAASARGYLWIPLSQPGPQHRGRLGLFIEESIENHLEERGALPPGIHASTGLDASLSDQLYRARLVEMRGIALGVPSLEGITNLGRALDAEDSAVLRWWMAATSDRPVRMVISKENTRLRVYPSPVLFESLFEVAPGPVTPLPPSPSMAASSQTMELSDLPPAVTAPVEETNILGTEVESAEESQDVVPEPGGDSEWQDEGWDDDVELPDLDRALGLAPEVSEEPSVAPPVVEAAPEVGAESEDVPAPVAPAAQELAPKKEITQLALDYESEEPPRAETIVASPPPPPEEPEATASEAPVREELEIAEEVGPVEAEAHEADETEAEAEVADAMEDIDAEEFLRTLQEDSERAPEVEEASVLRDEDERAEAHAPETDESLDENEPSEEPQITRPEPTPLPTKKIARNPFIRMANPEEAIADSDAPNEEAVVAAPEQPSELIPQTSESQESGSPDEAAHTGDATEALSASEQTPQPEAPATTSFDPQDPFNQLAEREWKSWVKNLEAARGPKPLSVIERMFVTDYTRLREAVRRGVAEPSASGILDEWRDSFTGSYSEAFDALRVRGKRPTMVLDLPELASRLGRLQGARRVQLLMVDSLRFDLGLMVQERMRSQADASLTERLLLWSALPSVTSYQLELLGKGPDGLKEDGATEEPPALVARGKAALSPRRVRTGSLELLKLDVVADALRQPGAPVQQRMGGIADATAAAIVEHMAKQAPRTMVVVFGDHGFSLDPAKAGTTEEVLEGGATPEEVLVPAFAWLTGAVH